MTNLFDVITKWVSLVKKWKTPAVSDATTAMAIYKTKQIVWTELELKKIAEIDEKFRKIANVVGK